MANSLGQDIASHGYEGDTEPNDDWAIVQHGLGNHNWVDDADACKVTADSGGTRQVNIAAGLCGSAGIVDTLGDGISVTLDSVASGTAYSLVGIERTWGGSQESTVTVITGGSSPTTLPTFDDDEGTAAFQPLAYVPLTAGSTVPGTPIDLRIVGSSFAGIRIAYNTLALQLIDFIGARVLIGTDLWTRGLSGWSKDPGRRGGITLPVRTDIGSSVGGWGAGYFGSRAVPDGNGWHIDFLAYNNHAVISFDATGNCQDETIFTFGSEFRPEITTKIDIGYRDSAGAVRDGLALLFTNGVFQVVSGVPNTQIAMQSVIGGVPSNWSVIANFEVYRAVPASS